MTIRIICFLSILAVAPCASAQETVRVHGTFGRDSVTIGEVVPFTLTASYPRNKQVAFPDSTFSFAPFEINRKQFFTTRTIGETSYDSAIYYVSTFEIDSVQSLKLPVFILQEKDCLAVYSADDKVGLQYRVNIPLDTIAVDKLPLKISTAYQKVKWIFNYPILLAVLLILLVACVVGWLVFGKRIRKYFAIRRLRKNYQEFLAGFSQVVDNLASEFSRRRAEDALYLWKRYMEGLEEFPYTKSTSREIFRRIANPNLDKALRTIDRGIYGGVYSSVEPFRFLQTYSQEQYQKREAEVKNG